MYKLNILRDDKPTSLLFNEDIYAVSEFSKAYDASKKREIYQRIIDAIMKSSSTRVDDIKKSLNQIDSLAQMSDEELYTKLASFTVEGISTDAPEEQFFINMLSIANLELSEFQEKTKVFLEQINTSVAEKVKSDSYRSQYWGLDYTQDPVKIRSQFQDLLSKSGVSKEQATVIFNNYIQHSILSMCVLDTTKKILMQGYDGHVGEEKPGFTITTNEDGSVVLKVLSRFSIKKNGTEYSGMDYCREITLTVPKEVNLGVCLSKEATVSCELSIQSKSKSLLKNVAKVVNLDQTILKGVPDISSHIDEIDPPRNRYIQFFLEIFASLGIYTPKEKERASEAKFFIDGRVLNAKDLPKDKPHVHGLAEQLTSCEESKDPVVPDNSPKTTDQQQQRKIG